MKNPYQRVGKKIRLFRRQAGITQALLAERAELSDNFIGLIERGEGRPTLDTINRIADVLGIRLQELFVDNRGDQADIKQIIGQLGSLLKRREQKDAQLILSLTKHIFECFPNRKN